MVRRKEWMLQQQQKDVSEQFTKHQKAHSQTQGHTPKKSRVQSWLPQTQTKNGTVG